MGHAGQLGTWVLGQGPWSFGTAALIHAKESTQVALSIYSLFMKEEKQGPSCHGNQEHHGPLSLQWEDGQVSSSGEPSTVYIMMEAGVGLLYPSHNGFPGSL